jgi:hypothetical protein
MASLAILVALRQGKARKKNETKENYQESLFVIHPKTHKLIKPGVLNPF